MSYDKEKLKIGYKGDFVIHNHYATNHHWDLRLEFPVSSVKESLKTYSEKRKWEEDKTNEPKPSSQEKSGTVLRSWAVPKHILPTSKPILATETEDHEISYGSFSGIIPKGHYGAGKINIYDKGKFKLVDIDYDKKYVVKFSGKKIKGYYALIKTKGKNFLWIKIKDKSKYERTSERLIEEIVKTAIIKKCPKSVQDDRPISEQQYCLFTSDGEKLLGRHPTREKAVKQEQAIEIHKHK